MDWRRNRRAGPDDLVTAAEIACWAYCPEQWRLEYGLGLPLANRAAMDAGTQHRQQKAAAERVAGSSITLGRFLAVLAAVVLLLLLWWWS
jgi:hypothetical protein